MERITPFFKLNGIRYEIKRTRFILAEYARLRNEIEMSDEDKSLAQRASLAADEVRKYASMLEELEAKFLETLDEVDEKRFLKVKELYERATEKLFELQAIELANRNNKKLIDLYENIAIIALAEYYFDKNQEKAKAVWEQFVDVKGQAFVIEWLSQMADSLFASDEEAEQDDFLSAKRKRAEQMERNRQAGAKKK